MCTILIGYQTHDIAPLVIAANRDEFFRRPTAGPQLLARQPRVLGGKDLEQGGTWMGLSEAGLFVGLTNRRSPATGRRSRGQLVLQALGLSSVQEIDAFLRAEARHCQFGPFNLIYGNADRLHVAHVPDDGFEIRQVAPGLHVLPSGTHLDDTREPRVQRGLQHLRRSLEADTEAALLQVLNRALCDPRVPTAEELPMPDEDLPFDATMFRRLHALYVETPMYGTRSSTIAMLGDSMLRYYYVDRENQGAPERFDQLLAPPAG